MKNTKYSFLDYEKFTKFRQELHKIPELGFEEFETKNFILNQSYTDWPNADLPFPVAPYNKMPLGTFILTLS